MPKVELRTTDPHYPLNSVVRVSVEAVNDLLKGGLYKYPHEPEQVQVKDYPDESWTEKRILDWIVSNNVPVKYVPKSDTKKEVLEKLRVGGFLKVG